MLNPLRLSGIACSLILALALPNVSGALTITLDTSGTDLSLTEADVNCGDPDAVGAFTCSGALFDETDYDFEITNLELDPDPTVVAAFAIVNNTGLVQSFLAGFLLPIIPLPGPVTVLGSIDGSLTEASGDTSTLTSVAGSGGVYQAQIDGVTVQTLLNHPFSVTGLNAFSSVDVGPASFGPAQLNIAANNTIGILLSFNLSPGDAASFTAVFTVEPVSTPEPASVVLAAMGLLGLLAYGRRRH